MRFFLSVILLSACTVLMAQPKVVAHRGYWDVEGSAQNSIASLEKAYEIGCYGSELDVIITRDGVVVVHHDDSIPVVRDGRPMKLRIEEQNYADIRNEKLKNGEKLPTLKQYLKRSRKLQPMQLILEVKPHKAPENEDRAVDAVVKLVRSFNLEERVEFISFSMRICERLHAQLPQNKVAYLNGDLSPRQVMAKGLTGVDYHYNVFLKTHPEWLDEAKEVGCEVNVWTVNNPEMLKGFAADKRVDLITTNAPVLLQEIINDRPVSMATRMDEALRESPLMKRSNMGVMVYDATTGYMLYQHDAGKLHRPASTMKLFTCATAVRDLGLDYPFSTQVKYTGQVIEKRKQRILDGDLYVIGGMNPTFTEADLELLVAECATLGVDSVAGKVFADLSMKTPVRSGQGWCWDDKGDDSPQLSPLVLERDTAFLPRFMEVLKKNGMGVRGTGYAVCPVEAKQLASHAVCLSELLPLCLKPSDNLVAESILYQLGKQDGTPFAGTEVSLAHVRRLMTEVCPDSESCSIVDGSGLSFYNMITPSALFHLLKYIYQSDFYESFREALPVAAQDGTLRNRLKGTPAANRIYAKTGSLTGTSALAGYAQAANGHTLIFVMMNDGVPRGENASARELQDKLCTIMCN